MFMMFVFIYFSVYHSVEIVLILIQTIMSIV